MAGERALFMQTHHSFQLSPKMTTRTLLIGLAIIAAVHLPFFIAAYFLP